MISKRELWERVCRWARGDAEPKDNLAEALTVAAEASTVAKLAAENLKLRDTVGGLTLDVAQVEASRDYQTDARMAERDRADKLAGALVRLRETILILACPLCGQSVGLVEGTMTPHCNLRWQRPDDVSHSERPDCPASGRRPESTIMLIAVGGGDTTGSAT